MQIGLRTALVLSATAILLAGTNPAAAGGRPDLVRAALKEGKARYQPDELIVQFRAGANESDFGAVRAKLGASDLEVIKRDSRRLTVLKLPKGISVEKAIARIEADPAVDFAEPNWIYTHQATSNDPYFVNGSLWGMQGEASAPANEFGSGAAEAWTADKQDCGDVFVGIIDEGYMYAHEDLAANAGKNPGEIANNFKDDDGNGRVDDVYGWDFAQNNKTVFDGVSDDHGTHVAGTIGAVGGNATGVAGVCWSLKLISAKFLGFFGGTTANAVRAIDYLTDLKTRHGLNMVASNNSWGGGGFSQALKNAISRAEAADILFIVAAGNEGVDCDAASNCYPAEYDNANIISVAAIDSAGGLASFSNRGATTVDIGAPGVGIWSTIPRRSGFLGVISGYASYNGTSMATPHVAGAAALYKAQNPGATAAQVKQAILDAATPTPSLDGKTVTGGRLDVGGF